MNARPVDVLRGAQFAPTPWRDVRVGDVVRVRDREAFPADLVLLSSSAMGSGGGGNGGGGGANSRGEGGTVDGVDDDAPSSSSPSSSSSPGVPATTSSSLRRRHQVPTGVAYVETANLDGETNLKMRQALPQTAELLSAAAVCRATVGGSGGGGIGIGGGGDGAGAVAAAAGATSSSSNSNSNSAPSRLRIECEQPNSAIYRFQGVLVTPQGERLPLSPNQVRGESFDFFFLVPTSTTKLECASFVVKSKRRKKILVEARDRAHESLLLFSRVPRAAPPLRRKKKIDLDFLFLLRRKELHRIKKKTSTSTLGFRCHFFLIHYSFFPKTREQLLVVFLGPPFCSRSFLLA